MCERDRTSHDDGTRRWDDGRDWARGRHGLGACVVVLLAAASGFSIACGEDSLTDPGDGPPPQEKTTDELVFLRPSDDAPPLLLGDSDGDGIPDTSFVATRGQDSAVEIFYEDPDQPGTRGDRFLEFELEEESLLRYPDDHPMAGAEFQPGDTVTITIQVAGDTLLAEFGPSGLQFNPDEPAELEMRFQNAERDTDDDGEDDLDEEEVDLWKQEEPGELWERSGVLKDLERDRIRAFVESFTVWALAV